MGCGAWNSLREWTEPVDRALPAAYTAATPVALDQLAIGDQRLSLGVPEFDRVLGGGLVPGSLVLIGGDPGIGKSTLVLQAAGSAAAQAPVLYVSAEESAAQVKMRAERLDLGDAKLLVLAETSLDAALRQADEIAPCLLVERDGRGGRVGGRHRPLDGLGPLTEAVPCAAARATPFPAHGLVTALGAGKASLRGAPAARSQRSHALDCFRATTHEAIG